jgi:hypothetical protein
MIGPMKLAMWRGRVAAFAGVADGERHLYGGGHRDTLTVRVNFLYALTSSLQSPSCEALFNQ